MLHCDSIHLTYGIYAHICAVFLSWVWASLPSSSHHTASDLPRSGIKQRLSSVTHHWAWHRPHVGSNKLEVSTISLKDVWTWVGHYLPPPQNTDPDDVQDTDLQKRASGASGGTMCEGKGQLQPVTNITQKALRYSIINYLWLSTVITVISLQRSVVFHFKNSTVPNNPLSLFKGQSEQNRFDPVDHLQVGKHWVCGGECDKTHFNWPVNSSMAVHGSSSPSQVMNCQILSF